MKMPLAMPSMPPSALAPNPISNSANVIGGQRASSISNASASARCIEMVRAMPLPAMSYAVP